MVAKMTLRSGVSFNKALELMVTLVAAIAIVLLAACDTAVGAALDASTLDAAPSASCLEAEQHSDLPWIQENIIGPSCANFTSCHKGSALSAGRLNLDSMENTFDNLVDKKAGVPNEDLSSTILPMFTQGLDIVEPGDPDSSYLIKIIEGAPGFIDPEIGTMPFNNPLLCKQKRDAVRRWVESLQSSGPDAGLPPDAGPVDGAAPDA